MRFNFAYVVPELSQVHSHVQMKTFPVSISTKSRNHMINVGKNHMELCSFSCIHHQDAPGWPTRVLGGAFAAEGPGYPTGLVSALLTLRGHLKYPTRFEEAPHAYLCL